MKSTRARRLPLGALIAASFLLVLVLHRTYPLVQCADTCFVDYFAIHEAQLAHFESPDVRLNAWILGWVNHALFTDPIAMFDTNAFHPAPNTLSGSEHLLGVALQTLPFGVFADNSVLLHQAALILSFLILSLTTFSVVRGMFGSTWGALMAGAAAAFMPWRFSELGHLQLLSVQWLPLVWLLTARVVTRTGSRRSAVWLGVVLGIQMLSSFYLAYLAVFSTAVLAVVLFVAFRPPLPVLLRFGVATSIPAVVTALTAIPYLSRYSGYRFSDVSTTNFYTDPSVTLALLAPPMALRADLAGIAPLTYHLPIVLLVGAVLALGWYAPARNANEGYRQKRAYILAFVLMGIGALTLMLGRQVVIADTTWTLPAHWLAQFVPGYSQMRAEFRWGIILGLAVPILAGAGVAWLEQCAARLTRSDARTLSLVAIRAGGVVLIASNVVFFRLPASDAWADASDVRAAHGAIAALEGGPVVEIPWRLHRINTATNGSRYMLASSEHWQPLLNGYSAYIPPTHHFLQRIARGLPDPQTVILLNRLTGLRWIVVHPNRLGAVERNRWNSLEPSDVLSLAVDEPDFQIYEVPINASSGIWREGLLAAEPGPRTLSGLIRAPIARPDRPGRIAVDLPASMRFELGSGIPDFAIVSFTNASEQTWPGLDIHREGLVLLRSRFFDFDGELVHEDTSSLDRDLPAGRKVLARALVQPPNRDGHFRVLFDVVQLWDGDFVDLGFPPVEAEISVTERKRLPGGGRD